MGDRHSCAIWGEARIESSDLDRRLTARLTTAHYRRPRQTRAGEAPRARTAPVLARRPAYLSPRDDSLQSASDRSRPVTSRVRCPGGRWSTERQGVDNICAAGLVLDREWGRPPTGVAAAGLRRFASKRR